MAVLLETSVGDLVFDLHVDKCPNTCKNFLKLCKIKYYNGCLFHNVQKDFIAQSGDPTGTGRGGLSLAGVLYGDQARFMDDELRPELRHVKKGTLSMVSGGQKNTNSTCTCGDPRDVTFLFSRLTLSVCVFAHGGVVHGCRLQRRNFS